MTETNILFICTLETQVGLTKGARNDEMTLLGR